jgi:hypothetical protein
MNKNRIPKYVFNVQIKGKYPRGKLRPRSEQQVRKDVMQKEGRQVEYGRKMRRQRQIERFGC